MSEDNPGLRGWSAAVVTFAIAIVAWILSYGHLEQKVAYLDEEIPRLHSAITEISRIPAVRTQDLEDIKQRIQSTSEQNQRDIAGLRDQNRQDVADLRAQLQQQQATLNSLLRSLSGPPLPDVRGR